jgi:ribonucleotide monophosphatase NagD (HAD superfamily)
MWLDRYRGLLCDLDGCLVAGGRLLPGARDLVAYARDRLVIVSNNSTDTPATLAAKLARLALFELLIDCKTGASAQQTDQSVTSVL